VKAKEIEGVDIQGKEFKLSEYQGKAILLDFFADWCPHCRRMYPNERDMVVKMKDRPFAILGVHCENQSVLDELDKKKTVTWRCWADGSPGPIAANWNVEAFPTLYLLDHQGIVRWQSNGAPDEAELAKMIEELVAEAEAQASGK
jgi:thiol-disulfide isomerase/thioredoxin